MNLKRTTRLVAGVLTLVSLTCILVRKNTRAQMSLDDGDTLWRITYAAKFQATDVKARLHVALPLDTANARLFHEDVLYSGMSAQHLRSSRELARELSLAAGNAGPHTLAARFDLHLSSKSNWRPTATRIPKTSQERDAYLQPTPTFPTTAPVVSEALEAMKLKPGADALARVREYCAQEIESRETQSNDALSTLRQHAGTPLGRARLMVTLCRALKIPARQVTGFRIDPKAETISTEFWVNALTDKGWIPLDPANGFTGMLPVGYVPVRFDGIDIVSGTEISELETKFQLQRLPPGPGALRAGRQHWTTILDLTRLPLEMHEPLAILLLMPLGALVTAIARTFIGVRTFGTFTPTLLALSFVYANWMTGLVTFALVLVIGLTSRTLLDRLKLLLVPRLGAMLTLVVLVIVFNVSLLDYFNLTPSAQAVILPMVILTMTVERFYLTSEEDSPAFALQLLFTTMCVAICCYLVLRWDYVGRFVLAYPEAHLLTIAIMMLLGRFSGYRLTELWRFRDLAKSPAPIQ